jgi:putative lipoprotein
VATIAPAASELPVASEAPLTETVVSGTIVLPEGVLLPGGASWSVELQDATREDAPAVVVAEVGEPVSDLAAAEIPFEIPYDPLDIEPAVTYTLRARVEDAAGALLYINEISPPGVVGGIPVEGAFVTVAPVLPGASVSPAASVAP